MKLSSALVDRTLDQFEAQAIPESHPVVPQLNSLFGDHTFFLNSSGLSVVEPTGTTDTGAQTAQVVKLAGWNDADRTSLTPHAGADRSGDRTRRQARRHNLGGVSAFRACPLW